VMLIGSAEAWPSGEHACKDDLLRSHVCDLQSKAVQDKGAVACIESCSASTTA
jgi:hypothetical protein